MNLVELGHELKRLRQGKGLTQSELASRSGVSRLTVTRLESGNLNELGFMKLARLFGAVDSQLVVKPAKHGVTLDDLAQEAH